MSVPTPVAVEATLAEFKDPETGRGLKQQGQIKDIQVVRTAVGGTAVHQA